MSSRALLVLLAATGTLASATANAANFSPNLNIRSPGVTNTSTLAGPTHQTYPTPKGPPPIPRSSANDPYDTSANLNPGGGGGGGYKPGNKPNLQ